ncbi:hypothetical protein K437DRAFT_274623 [Tilletiaria anomala UBC 951]|uniref:C2H2-type domain-containing protein n=1 Tax=Tilletiaria anomala (strain ATCC 24038 / CBS 436.72 / UBC 951) TaxID=1037660 RepID=A0A066W0D7_TILAU|nr:uncharacterized protein K437DRAFT_274623 [Tilletiaria anomala UBC 951]KDN44250.1 hypothetical protein K437DRAFT_274623 [Tilletiaria anomala UBC 951]
MADQAEGSAPSAEQAISMLASFDLPDGLLEDCGEPQQEQDAAAAAAAADMDCMVMDDDDSWLHTAIDGMMEDVTASIAQEVEGAGAPPAGPSATQALPAFPFADTQDRSPPAYIPPPISILDGEIEAEGARSVLPSGLDQDSSAHASTSATTLDILAQREQQQDNYQGEQEMEADLKKQEVASDGVGAGNNEDDDDLDTLMDRLNDQAAALLRDAVKDIGMEGQASSLENTGENVPDSIPRNAHAESIPVPATLEEADAAHASDPAAAAESISNGEDHGDEREDGVEEEEEEDVDAAIARFAEQAASAAFSSISASTEGATSGSAESIPTPTATWAPAALVGLSKVQNQQLEVPMQQEEEEEQRQQQEHCEEFLGDDIDLEADIEALAAQALGLDENGNPLPGTDLQQAIAHQALEDAVKRFTSQQHQQHAAMPRSGRSTTGPGSGAKPGATNLPYKLPPARANARYSHRAMSHLAYRTQGLRIPPNLTLHQYQQHLQQLYQQQQQQHGAAGFRQPMSAARPTMPPPARKQPAAGTMGSNSNNNPGAPKRWKCDKCDRAFARAYNLHTHMATHDPDPTRSKPFQCPFPACQKDGGRAFSRKHDLQRHVASVHEQDEEPVVILNPDGTAVPVPISMPTTTAAPVPLRASPQAQAQGQTPPLASSSASTRTVASPAGLQTQQAVQGASAAPPQSQVVTENPLVALGLGVPQKKFRCDMCGRSFVRRDALTKHHCDRAGHDKENMHKLTPAAAAANTAASWAAAAAAHAHAQRVGETAPIAASLLDYGAGAGSASLPLAAPVASSGDGGDEAGPGAGARDEDDEWEREAERMAEQAAAAAFSSYEASLGLSTSFPDLTGDNADTARDQGPTDEQGEPPRAPVNTASLFTNTPASDPTAATTSAKSSSKRSPSSESTADRATPRPVSTSTPVPARREKSSMVAAAERQEHESLALATPPWSIAQT